MQNRIDQLFEKKHSNILSIYFSAGYPKLNDTAGIIKSAVKAGADIVEIGVPFSDPIADGPTIQTSNNMALKNGMNLRLLFDQLRDIRHEVSVPLILMSYINPVMQFGIEQFCAKCHETGIDGLILPDFPLHEYIEDYKTIFTQLGIHNICLITPQTSLERINLIDKHSSGFIYMVSSASITGAQKEITPHQIDYFKRVKGMGLRNPLLIGFGISNKKTFQTACKYANGAIVGSVFIDLLKNATDIDSEINMFITSIKDK